MTMTDPVVAVGGNAPYSGPLVAAGATATVTSTLPITSGLGVRGLVFVVNVSAFTSGTLTVAISGVSSTAGASYTYAILTSAALGATGTTTLRIGLGLTAVSNLTVNDVVPSTVQVVSTVSGGGVLTYGIDYILAV